MWIIGQVATPGGALQHRDLAGGVDVAWLPAVGYLRQQPAHIPILIQHDETTPVGHVAYLERSKADGLVMLGEIRDDWGDMLAADADGPPWFLSSGVAARSITERHHERAVLEEVSLTRDPASVNLRPLRWSLTDTEPHNLVPLRFYDTWRRGMDAARSAPYRRGSDGLTINDLDPINAVDMFSTDPALAHRRAAALPKRRTATRAPAAPPGSVRFAGRVFTGEAADYLLSCAGYARAADGSLIRL